jgi:hypothetical protein
LQLDDIEAQAGTDWALGDGEGDGDGDGLGVGAGLGDGETAGDGLELPAVLGTEPQPASPITAPSSSSSAAFMRTWGRRVPCLGVTDRLWATGPQQ